MHSRIIGNLNYRYMGYFAGTCTLRYKFSYRYRIILFNKLFLKNLYIRNFIYFVQISNINSKF